MLHSGVPTSQSGSPAKKRFLNWRSSRRTDSCYVGNQPLYFQYMTLKKLCIRAQEGIPRSQLGAPTTIAASSGPNTFKIIPYMSRFALSGGLTAVTSVTNYSIFIKWSQVKLLGLKMALLHHKVTPRSPKWSKLSKRTPKLSPREHVPLCHDPK